MRVLIESNHLRLCVCSAFSNILFCFSQPSHLLCQVLVTTMKKIVQIYFFVLHGVLVPKDRLNKNFLSIFLLNQSSNVFRSRRIVFKKGLLNQEYLNILLVGILNMEIPQGFVPAGDKTAINWATLSFLILSSSQLNSFLDLPSYSLLHFRLSLPFSVVVLLILPTNIFLLDFFKILLL